MTDDTMAAIWSPQSIRETRFPQRLRGYDEAEVHAFLDGVATQFQRHRDIEVSMRAEISRLEALVSNEDVQERAVALFSQAQMVADQLVAEAVQHAQDMMSAARAQEREILARTGQMSDSALAAGGLRAAGSTVSAGSTGSAGTGSADVGYVHSYAKLAAAQLRSVLDALSEQVDRLSELPERPEPGDDHRIAAPAYGHDATAYGQTGRRSAVTALDSDVSPDDGEPLIWASMVAPPPAREPGW